MLVKVCIRRKIKEGHLKNAFVLIRKLRTMAMNQHGHISGETLVNYHDPLQTVVVGTWQSLDDWQSWRENPLRKETERQLDVFLEGPAQYEVFVYSKHHLTLTGDASLGSAPAT